MNWIKLCGILLLSCCGCEGQNHHPGFTLEPDDSGFANSESSCPYYLCKDEAGPEEDAGTDAYDVGVSTEPVDSAGLPDGVGVLKVFPDASIEAGWVCLVPLDGGAVTCTID